MCSQLSEANKHAAGLREEADRSTRLMRELALMKDARKAEAERATALRQKLTEAVEARKRVDERVAQLESAPPETSQAVIANRDLEKQVCEGRSLVCARIR